MLDRGSALASRRYCQSIIQCLTSLNEPTRNPPKVHDREGPPGVEARPKHIVDILTLSHYRDFASSTPHAQAGRRPQKVILQWTYMSPIPAAKADPFGLEKVQYICCCPNASY